MEYFSEIINLIEFVIVAFMYYKINSGENKRQNDTKRIESDIKNIKSVLSILDSE